MGIQGFQIRGPYLGLTQTPWADPKGRSTSGFHNLHHRSTRVQNWGFYLGVDGRLRFELQLLGSLDRGSQSSS